MSVFLTTYLKTPIESRIKLQISQFGRKFKTIRKLSSHSARASKNEVFTPFLEVLAQRKAEASRSILVQVNSANSYKELHSYCSVNGTVLKMLHYSTGVEPMNFILVELASEHEVCDILSRSSYVNDPQVVPAHSPFLWFKATRKGAKLSSSSAELLVENGTRMPKSPEMFETMQACESVSGQMAALYQMSKLNDLGTRLRFLTARQIQQSLSGMFPDCAVYPFGSSVNGFGKMGCDLDLVLRLSEETRKEESRLIFQSKAMPGSERTNAQRNMEAIGDLLHLFLPGCTQVRRILQARIPIIKYYQQLSDIECDLSMSNMSGVHMSDFLYIMGSIDERVRPLIFAVRNWAREIGLTNSSPGRWITNFSLTLLVLSYLQKPLHSPPILPSLNTLIKLAGPGDQYVTEDGINCTFLRDVTKLKNATKNTESLQSLLLGFFEYYSQFEFASKAVCLNEASSITKPEHCALYIVNPLERGLNVSKNVSLEELERFKNEARNAAWLLESQEEKSETWGMLSLFSSKKTATMSGNLAKNRMVDVSTLFGEQEEIEYKNPTVKKEVESIRNETKVKLEKLKKISR